MGWFDGASEVSSSHSHHHRKGSSGKHHSSSRSHGHRSPSPRGSIFGLGSSHHNASTRSFFAPFGKEAGRGSSYYKRSPREGYLKSIYAKLRRLLRDLVYYMKKHPMKVFMLVIMPLITGGALTGLLAKFGLRLPPGVEKMFGGAGRGRGGGMEFERTRVEASGPLGGLGNMMGSVGGIGNAMKLAKMFM